MAKERLHGPGWVQKQKPKRPGRNAGPKEKRGQALVTLTPEQLGILGAMVAADCSNEAISVELRISLSTLMRLKRRDTVVKDTVRRARAIGLAQVQTAMFQMARSGKNFPASKYWLAVKGGPEWREPHLVHHDIAEDGLLDQYLSMTPEQRAARIRELEDKRRRKT